MNNNISIRKIQESDNEKLAKIIRAVLREFDGDKPGTAYYDYDTDHMYEAYQSENEIYLVAEHKNKLIGGCGIKKLAGDNKNICELQKLYLSNEARGLGVGKALVEKCISFAEESKYKQCYLETFPNMDAAISLYKKFEFYNLDKPIGNTGHNGCDIWLMKDLN